MNQLDQIILRATNPFDTITLRSGNFWLEEHQKAVNSIHQNELHNLSNIVKLVAKDQRSRSILLKGDSGCGKSYLLGRLKKDLNAIAFFVYIEPCQEKDNIWRHTLRKTVDSLMYIPEGEKQSQLQLWLQGLSAFKEKTLIGKLLGEKAQFVGNFCATYPTGIYEPKQFFSVLYELAAKPENQFIAHEWLKGAILDDYDLKKLGVKMTIDEEAKARGIIGNFGRIADATKPIILCFDQVENAPKLGDGSLDMSHVFNLNTSIHNDFLRNFCVIISIIKQTFIKHKKSISQSDFARFEQEIELKNINLQQALALWKLRLSTLHQQIKPLPNSEIAPLEQQELEKNFPGGKANLRSVLILGNSLFSEYKSKLAGIIPSSDPLPEFKLKWQHELNQQQKINRIKYYSSIELKIMLQQALECLGMKTIKDKFLTSKIFAPCSFVYKHEQQYIGLLWYEESSLKSFSFAMKACSKFINNKQINSLILIRAEILGNSQNMGYKNYQRIFQDISSNSHIIPSLDSVHYLRTYQVLANAAQSGELVINNQVISLEQYHDLVKQSQLLKECVLLQQLTGISEPTPTEKVEETIMNIMKTYQIMSKTEMIKNVIHLLPKVKKSHINYIITQLCHQHKIQVLSSSFPTEGEIISLIPQ